MELSTLHPDPDPIAKVQHDRKLHRNGGRAVFRCREEGSIHVVYFYPGSAAIMEPPKCQDCGKKMEFFEGDDPSKSEYINA